MKLSARTALLLLGVFSLAGSTSAAANNDSDSDLQGSGSGSEGLEIDPDAEPEDSTTPEVSIGEEKGEEENKTKVSHYQSPFPLCSDLPKKSTKKCYPNSFLDCLSFIKLDRYPFLDNFDPIKHHFYDQLGGGFVSKVDYCKEFLKDEQARREGTYKPRTYKKLDPDSRFDCYGRSNFLRMGWMESDPQLLKLVSPFNRKNRKSLCYARVQQRQRQAERERREYERANLWYKKPGVVICAVLGGVALIAMLYGCSRCNPEDEGDAGALQRDVVVVGGRQYQSPRHSSSPRGTPATRTPAPSAPVTTVITLPPSAPRRSKPEAPPPYSEVGMTNGGEGGSAFEPMAPPSYDEAIVIDEKM